MEEDDDFPEDLLDSATQTLLLTRNDWDMDSDTIPSQVPDPQNFFPPPEVSTSSRFATRVSDQELKDAQEASVPANTRKQTSWSVNVWKAWSDHQRPLSIYNCPPHLLILAKNSGELNRWLCRYVLEVRRQDGKEYPPNMLYQICCGILRYVRGMVPDMDIFRQPAFSGFQKTLDSEMKRLKSCGKGSVPKRAEPISLEEENSLWEQGLLGDHSPKVMVETMIHMCGLFFAMRSVSEHHQLKNSDIDVVERSGEVVYNESTPLVVGLKDERWSQRELYTMPTKKTQIAALYDY